MLHVSQMCSHSELLSLNRHSHRPHPFTTSFVCLRDLVIPSAALKIDGTFIIET